MGHLLLRLLHTFLVKVVYPLLLADQNITLHFLGDSFKLLILEFFVHFLELVLNSPLFCSQFPLLQSLVEQFGLGD